MDIQLPRQQEVSKSLSRASTLLADGSFVYKMTRKQHDVQALQQDLQAWEKILKMPFNPTKCEVIRITWKRAPVNTTYLIHDHPLQLVKQKKYVVVILSDKLSWTRHFEMVIKKANNTRAFLRRNISRCPRDVKARCYESLVRPNLEYTSSVWNPYIMGNIQQLEAAQMRAACFVSGDYHTTSSVSHMVCTIGWKSIQHRRQPSKCVTMYRITNKLVAIYSHTFNLLL